MIPIPFGFLTSGVGLPSPNTFIGGVSSVITNEAQLASYLSIITSNISNFVISGSDISCHINTNYTTNNHAFNNDGSAFDWGNGAIMTYYWDEDGRCTNWGVATFDAQTNMRNWYFPNVTTNNGQEVFKSLSTTTSKVFLLPALQTITANDEMFRVLDSALIVMPNLTQLGPTVGDDAIFLDADNSDLYCDVSLATVNGGSPDGDITYLDGRTNTNIYYSDNDTAPNSIADLAVDTVGGLYLEISWSAPTSSNPIHWYLVFVDLKYVGKTTSLSYTITGLSLNTSYDIFVITLDSEGNTSRGNVVTQTTSATYVIPTGNIISYWNFDTDSLDQVGTNDGTDTAMSYVSTGGIGNSADFTAGTSSNVSVADAANLSFGNGTTDSPFSIILMFKLTSKNQLQFIGKRDSGNNNKEYHVWLDNPTSNVLNFRLFDQSSGGQLNINYTLTPSLSTWYEVAATYNGSGLASGLKLYVNAASVGTTSTSGTYTAMENGTGTLMFGKAQMSTLNSLDGYEDEPAIFDKELTAAEVNEIYAKHQAGQYLTE